MCVKRKIVYPTCWVVIQLAFLNEKDLELGSFIALALIKTGILLNSSISAAQAKSLM